MSTLEQEPLSVEDRVAEALVSLYYVICNDVNESDVKLLLEFGALLKRNNLLYEETEALESKMEISEVKTP